MALVRLVVVARLCKSRSIGGSGRYFFHESDGRAANGSDAIGMTEVVRACASGEVGVIRTDSAWVCAGAVVRRVVVAMALLTTWMVLSANVAMARDGGLMARVPL